ncbi:MAG TPA: M56 family metallopeptidase, partial [Pirellulales bacterium]|nr:M56 family metallopeptidase [Pirellulales bacterium]
PPGDARTVLAHELAHLRRGDVWLNWLRLAVVGFWWFHPVAWLLSRTLRQVNEDCCDDLLLVDGVTNQTDYCDTLLRVAAQISGGPSAGITLGMAHRLHPLGHRLLRIMDGRLRRRARLSAGGLCLLLLLAGVSLPGAGRNSLKASPAAAQPQEREQAVRQPTSSASGANDEKRAAAAQELDANADAESNDDGDAPISGIVTDAAQQPVAGAAVWLLGGDGQAESLERRAATTTDRRGRFAFPQFTADALFKPASGQDLPSLLVRDKRNRLGWAANLRDAGASRLEIKLHEVGEFHGKLLAADGKPIAGATVRPWLLNSTALRDPGYDSIKLPTALVEAWECKTSQDGSFSLPRVPTDGSMTARIAAAGYGEPLLRWDLGKNVEFTLQRAGAVAGSVQIPDGIQLPAELKLDLRRQSEPLAEGLRYRINYYASSSIDEQRHFEFADVPPGTYIVSLQQTQRSPVFAEPSPPIVVPAGARAAELDLPLQRTARLRGVAVDQQDKQPLKDVTLRFYRRDAGGRLSCVSDETTDDEGRFEVYVRPGKVVVEVWGCPPGHLRSVRDARKESIDVERDAETVVEVERSIEVRGTVFDGDGRAVPNAELYFITATGPGLHANTPPQHADDKGAFELTDIDPQDNLPIRARSGSAVSDGVVLIEPEQLDESIRMQVRESNACRLTGRVVDEMGRELADVTVHVSGNRGYQSRRVYPSGLSTSVAIEDLQTDEEGRFISSALWPRDSYQASVAATGFARAESKLVTGKPGETLDLGTIVLRRNDSFVAGRVVDSLSQPVEGVSVFNQGDGLQPVSVVTDGAGRFRLQGLFGGRVYVFARKAGHRFTGVRTTSGASDVVVTLLRNDEPPAADQPAGPPEDTSQQEQLARWMLEQCWALPQPKDKWLLIRYMARMDAEQAAKWSAQLNRKYDSQIAIGISERLQDVSYDDGVQIDADDALAALTGLSDSRTVHFLIQLAGRAAAKRPDDALRFVEEANLRLRKLPPPERIWASAQIGHLLTTLGRADAGRKLLAEAAKAAEQLPVDDRSAYARGKVARELAAYDLDRAETLVESIPLEADSQRYLSWLAEAMATRDLDRGLALVEQITGDLNAETLANHTRLKIAYRIAASRPAEALRVLDGMEGNNAEKARAEALAWIATQVAERDKPLAYELIDRSLQLYRDKPEAFRSWSGYGGRPALAAWVARIARQIGYPDMHSVVMRVLALRPTQQEEYDPLQRLEANAATAWVLAFAAPDTSRELLESLAPFDELIGSGYTNFNRGEWINAWAIVDPEHAKEIFERELAAVRDQPDFDLQLWGRLRAAEMLSQPASQWPRHLLINFGPFWLPGEE